MQEEVTQHTVAPCVDAAMLRWMLSWKGGEIGALKTSRKVQRTKLDRQVPIYRSFLYFIIKNKDPPSHKSLTTRTIRAINVL